MSDAAPLVAIFNASDDTVEMLEEVLRLEGLRTVSGHVSDVKRGHLDFIAFIEQHQPHVIIWDISPPYQANWVFFQLLRSSEALNGRGLVVTTTHIGHLDRAAGHETGALELIGKPYDLEGIAAAVRSALASRDR